MSEILGNIYIWVFLVHIEKSLLLVLVKYILCSHFTQICILLYFLEAKNPYFVTKNCWKSSYICVFILPKKRRNWYHKNLHNSGMVGRRKLPDPSLNCTFNVLPIGVQYTFSFQWTNFGLKCLVINYESRCSIESSSNTKISVLLTKAKVLVWPFEMFTFCNFAHRKFKISLTYKDPPYTFWLLVFRLFFYGALTVDVILCLMFSFFPVCTLFNQSKDSLRTFFQGSCIEIFDDFVEVFYFIIIESLIIRQDIWLSDILVNFCSQPLSDKENASRTLPLKIFAGFLFPKIGLVLRLPKTTPISRLVVLYYIFLNKKT